MEALALENQRCGISQARRAAAERLLLSAGRAHQLASRVALSPEAAEDAVQQAFLGVMSELPVGLAPEEERLWFFRVAINAARKQARGEARRRSREMSFMQERAGAAAPALPDGEMVAVLRQAMVELEVEYRLPVALCCEQGLTQRQAARILEMPERTVSKYVQVGLERLHRALERQGITCAPAALVGGLQSAAPGVPAGLAARLECLLTGSMATPKTDAAAAHAAAKGGIAVKVIVGVVLAGALAGTIGLMGRIGPMNSNSPPAPSGPPKHEHFASINSEGDDLDGPAKEAIGFRGGSPDAEGNLWGGRWMRASDGRVLRLSAYEYGTLGFDLKEGPVVGRPVKYVGTDYGWWCGGSAMMGRPDSGGKTDGIYESLGREGQMIRIWKNKDKGGRWWFARAAGGGGAAAPKTKGQSADALAVKFGWINEPQVGLDNKLRFMADNCFYLLEDGKVTCVLSPEDYKAATEAMKSALPNQGYVGGDGTIYLGYYYSSGDAYSGKAPGVWRVTADGKVEPWAKSSGKLGDGDALNQASWFCGPHLGQYSVARFIPPDALLTTAHDEDFCRRVQKGRTAVLCTDGEWREFAQERRPGSVDACGMTVGPNGTIYHSFRNWVDYRLYRWVGFDFGKPTAKLREGGKP